MIKVPEDIREPQIKDMIEFKMPKMGESIQEATIIRWLKQVGEAVTEGEILVEVATDKVDNEVPSPVSGIVREIRFAEKDLVQVGEVMAVIDGDESVGEKQKTTATSIPATNPQPAPVSQPSADNRQPTTANQLKSNPDAFLSPLVISIAQKENLSLEEVQSIPGSGADGRIRKSDIFNYLKNRKYPLRSENSTTQGAISKPVWEELGFQAPKVQMRENDRVIEMDRMRQMIAGHMVYSKQTSPHVTSYVEADVTNLVKWRETHRAAFEQMHGQKLTFTPVFVQAVAKAVADFPMINIAVDGNKVIVRGNINIGMATALPTGNLIVPVVRDADQKGLHELAADVNRLADAARTGMLKADDIQGSTFTISNVGTFGSLMGTPIINQPEVAILALGIIKKRPEVISGTSGDEIAIRSMMFLSLSFDHRVVDGYLGGSFLRRVADYLEQFDINSPI